MDKILSKDHNDTTQKQPLMTIMLILSTVMMKDIIKMVVQHQIQHKSPPPPNQSNEKMCSLFSQQITPQSHTHTRYQLTIKHNNFISD